MTYLQESLSQGEDLHTVFELHWVVRLAIVAWAIVAIVCLRYVGLPLAIIFACVALGEWVKLRSIEQAVTNKRVILKTGIVARKTEEMKLSSIETVEIYQSIWGRMLGFGTVKVTGRGLSDVVFKNIDDPMRVKRTIEGIEPIG
jgi:hypothetical protein